MASLFRDRRSGFWYLKFRDRDGKWKLRSTKFRVGSSRETVKARELCAEHSLRERQAPASRNSAKEAWTQWVDAALQARCKSAATLTRYRGCWQNLRTYLEEHSIATPRLLTFQHCRGYLDWRSRQKVNRRPITRSTIVTELKVLGILMTEAVRLGFATANPCHRLGIAKGKPREKPALTDEQITLIRRKLATEPDWMRHAFELALHHGCRLSECRVAMADIDDTEGVLYFRSTKGDKPFVVPIHPGIRTLIAERRAAGASVLCDLPPNASRTFGRFFRRIGLEGVSFHCTRVTVATWLARNPAVPEKQAMHYLNHASETVHRAYQRWRPSDVSAVVAAVAPPPPAS